MPTSAGSAQLTSADDSEPKDDTASTAVGSTDASTSPRPQPGPTIAVVVLTLNEGSNIERCLQSVGWADEVVVVDSGSTDRTVELACAQGARVVGHRQKGNFLFAEQRNWALEHGDLTCDWILFVDADEVIPTALATEIRRCCEYGGGPDAYQLAPKYLFWGRWMRRSMRYPSWHDRLLRLGKVTFAGGVWEHFSPGIQVGRINEPYLHYGNSKGFEEWLERHSRYSSWDASAVLRYLDTGAITAFGTQRRLRSRRIAARFWRLRPVGRFLVMFVARGGFLDGPEAFMFCMRYALYEYMTVEKIIEERRRRTGLPL
jgi:glycosyltransferase involved in cell wall biosynthesis